MAIKFTFILNDADAANLIDIMRSEKFRCADLIIEEMAGENRQEFIQWHKDQSDYIQKLIDRILLQQERMKDSKEYSCEQTNEKDKD